MLGGSMFKGMIAVVTAATGAAVIVTLIPPPGPAAARSETKVASVTPVSVAPVAAAPAVETAKADTAKADCAQPWPFYDSSCLRDARHPNSKTRVTRVITTDKSVADRAPPARQAHR
jgi:hypothetical protein